MQRLQFSLRAFLVAVAVLGPLLGLAARRIHRQRAAAAAVEALGGWVMYESEWAGRDAQRRDWIEQYLPRDCLEDVVFVGFRARPKVRGLAELLSVGGGRRPSNGRTRT